MIRKQESFVKMEYEFLYELLVIPCANCRGNALYHAR